MFGPRSSTRAKRTLTPKEQVEYVHRVVLLTITPILDALFTGLVVEQSFFRVWKNLTMTMLTRLYVDEHLICHWNVLELVASLGIFIGVKLHGKLPAKSKQHRKKRIYQEYLWYCTCMPSWWCRHHRLAKHREYHSNASPPPFRLWSLRALKKLQLLSRRGYKRTNNTIKLFQNNIAPISKR